MKNLKMIYTTFGILALWFVLMSYSTNPPNGMTGAPTEGTCGNCHSGTTYNAGSVSMTGVPASIMPSTTYTITVTATSTAVKGGFQLCVLDGANTNCGTLAATSTDVRVEGTTRKYAEQTASKAYAGGSVSWSFNWTSPASLTNTTIKFYYSSALCNGNNNDTGDTNKSSSFTGTLAAGVQPVSASISATTNVTCNGASTGSAAAAVTGGTPPYTYAWSNGQNTQVATNLSAGTYIVTITGGAQSGTATATVTQPSAINITTVNNSSTLTCNAPVASISVLASGGTGTIQYAWSNGVSGSTLSATSAGTYIVTATDANLCTKTSSYAVTSDFTPPTVTATAVNPVLGCNSTSTSLSATGGGTYNWSNGLGTSASVNVSPSATSTYTVTVTGSNGCTATKSVTVTVDNSVPTLSVSANPTALNCSNPTTALSAAGNGTFAWSNGSTGSTFAQTPIINTTYTVTITGSNGCTASKSVSVIVDKTLPTATAVAATPTVNCTTPSTTLTATGGTLYSWSNGLGTSAATAAVTPSVNTTYTVTVTGSNGCTASKDVTVNVDKIIPTANISASANTITCQNTSTVLTALPNGTSYVWSNGLGNSATTAAVTPTTTTTYTVTVTAANGCTAATSKTIDVNTTKPNISLTPKTATLSCTSASVALAVASTTSGATFSWSGPNGFTANTANINAATAGKYFANIFNPINGCSAVDSAIVVQDANVPTVSVNNGSISCKTTSAALSATSSVAGSTFSWSGPNNFTATGASATVTAPGTYVVNVTAPNGCKAAANSVVGNNAQPVSVNAGLDTKVCSGTSATLSAKTSCVVCFVTYQWTNSGGSITSATNISNITALGAGSYIVVAKDTITGCIGKDTVTVGNFQVPTAVASASFQDCKGCVDVKVTGAGAPYAYAWSNGNTTTKNCNLTANTYTVTVTTVDACKVIASATTTTPPAINVALTKVTNATIGQTNGAITIAVTGGSGAFTYAWTKTGNPQVIGTTQNIATLGVGIYVVTVKDANGCTATFTAEVKGVVGTEDIEANRYMSVFPNPNDGHFVINLYNITTANLRILNIEGQLMLSQILETENNIDLSLLPKGMYFIQLNTAEKMLVKRIVIE